MSKAASKVAMSSLRLTNTVRSAFRKSACRTMSMWTSARVASVNRLGPASMPASCSSRANAPKRGSRSGLSGSGTSRLLDERRHLFAHTLQVLLVFERRPQGGVDQRGVDASRAQRSERSRPVQRLGDTGHLVQVHAAQSLDEARDLSRQAIGGFRRAGTDDLDLLLKVRVGGPGGQAAALERVVRLASPAGGDHDHTG